MLVEVKFAHLNERLLVAHFNSVKALITKHDLDVLALSETCLTSSICDSSIKIKGYTLLRLDRNTGSRGWGVVFYIGSSLTFKPLLNYNTNCNHLELLLISVDAGPIGLAVGVFHRPEKKL